MEHKQPALECRPEHNQTLHSCLTGIHCINAGHYRKLIKASQMQQVHAYFMNTDGCHLH